MARGIVKTVMVGQRGDTLLEVTFALAILAAVLLGCTSLAAAAYRLGQTARERTSVADVMQEQMEALRSFRDNSIAGTTGLWSTFRNGVGGSYPGIDNVGAVPCNFQASLNCFHMALVTVGGSTMWVPAPGALTTSSPGTTLTVPTSLVEISASSATGVGGTSVADPNSDRICGYDFEIHSSFTPIGSGPDQTSKIQTRLVNLKYNPSLGGTCP
jgi:hypothetical protein